MQLTYDVVDDPGQEQSLLVLVGAFLRSVSDYPMHIYISNLPLLRVSTVVCVVVVLVINVLFVPDRINNRSHVQLYKDRISFNFQLELLHTFNPNQSFVFVTALLRTYIRLVLWRPFQSSRSPYQIPGSTSDFHSSYDNLTSYS